MILLCTCLHTIINCPMQHTPPEWCMTCWAKLRHSSTRKHIMALASQPTSPCQFLTTIWNWPACFRQDVGSCSQRHHLAQNPSERAATGWRKFIFTLERQDWLRCCSSCHLVLQDAYCLSGLLADLSPLEMALQRFFLLASAMKDLQHIAITTGRSLPLQMSTARSLLTSFVKLLMSSGLGIQVQHGASFLEVPHL